MAQYSATSSARETFARIGHTEGAPVGRLNHVPSDIARAVAKNLVIETQDQMYHSHLLGH
jgi:hypothetical protein